MYEWRRQRGQRRGRFAIVVVARFNQSITARMLDGAVETLVAHGMPDDRIDVAWVPGAFEIPTVAARLAAGRPVRRHPLPGRRDPRPDHARPAHQSGGEHGPGAAGRAVQAAGDFRRPHLRDARTGHCPQRRPVRPPPARTTPRPTWATRASIVPRRRWKWWTS